MMFSKKFWGPLGYVLASSLVSKRCSKNQKVCQFSKIKCFSEVPESYLKSFAAKIKFIALFSHRFMHSFIFHVFDWSLGDESNRESFRFVSCVRAVCLSSEIGAKS